MSALPQARPIPTPIISPERQGQGRMLIHEVTQRDIGVDPPHLAG